MILEEGHEDKHMDIPHLEEGVHEQDPDRLDTRGVQQNWLGQAGETLAVKEGCCECTDWRDCIELY